jgi:hypothetical protein
MSLLCDYFRANTDATASATASWPGGPSQPPSTRGGPFRKKAVETPQPLPTVEFPGVEPVVMLATLEELLTGAATDVAVDANADAQVGSHKKAMVFRLRPELVASLAVTDDDRLREIADPWSETEEFFEEGDSEALAESLMRLANLARDAQASGEHLYCWVSR